LDDNNIKPIREWRPAIPGTVEKFKGIAAKHCPELVSLTAEEIEDALDEMRNPCYGE
jgi:hypothetical protein